MSSSKEVQDAVESAGDGADAETEEITRLEAKLNQPSEAQRLAELKATKRAQRLAQLRAVAEKRLVGIKRAAGSVKDQLEQAVRHLVLLVDGGDHPELVRREKGIVRTIQDCNEWFEKYEALLAEEAALVDRFGLDASDRLAPIVGPGLRADAVALGRYNVGLLERSRNRYAPQVEQDKTGLRTRRTYAEITGSPGHACIVDAGLLDFPPLTERQQEIVAAREADRARAAQQAAQLPAVPAVGPPGVSIGS